MCCLGLQPYFNYWINNTHGPCIFVSYLLKKYKHTNWLSVKQTMLKNNNRKISLLTKTAQFKSQINPCRGFFVTTFRKKCCLCRCHWWHEQHWQRQINKAKNPVSQICKTQSLKRIIHSAILPKWVLLHPYNFAKNQSVHIANCRVINVSRYIQQSSTA